MHRPKGNMKNKVKVRFMESIAVLADPKTEDLLNQKYEDFARQLQLKEKPPSAGTIKYLIDQKKKADRYGEPQLGFARDMAWKPGEEGFISADLAAKWQDNGICIILDADKKAA